MKRKNENLARHIKTDLHGMTAMQAFRVVLSTIERAYKNGDRDLVFITGIGDQARGTGVIRAEFPVYIDHPSVRGFILSSKYESGKYLLKLRKCKSEANKDQL